MKSSIKQIFIIRYLREFFTGWESRIFVKLKRHTLQRGESWSRRVLACFMWKIVVLWLKGMKTENGERFGEKREEKWELFPSRVFFMLSFETLVFVSRTRAFYILNTRITQNWNFSRRFFFAVKITKYEINLYFCWRCCCMGWLWSCKIKVGD